MMDIPIEDQNPFDLWLLLVGEDVLDGDGDVVEKTEPTCGSSARMMTWGTGQCESTSGLS
jgi:hypothetical protein